MPRKTAEEAHREAVRIQLTEQRIVLGPYASHSLRTDAKHLCFVLSRYKFCAKLFEGKKKVLEIGCGDAVGLPIVAQAVGHVYATDWDAEIIDENKQRACFLANCTFSRFNIAERPFPDLMDAVYLLDVIEHLEPGKEARVMQNIAKSLSTAGVCIIGTPNKEASRFASPQSEVGHINLKNSKELRALMERYFSNVFLFSMNDEIVHTGFSPMAHYLIAMGVGLRGASRERAAP
jgi:2-polyprenyl-3-methyl-5-hydroxy-6-metoxy-1,4-benzoquinol methylase